MVFIFVLRCFVPEVVESNYEMSPPLQFERVRVIYKYALDRIPKHQAQELFKYYTMFEKKFGDRRGIEDVIVSKRRFQYEEEVKVFTAETSCHGNKLLRNTWSLVT